MQEASPLLSSAPTPLPTSRSFLAVPSACTLLAPGGSNYRCHCTDQHAGNTHSHRGTTHLTTISGTILLVRNTETCFIVFWGGAYQHVVQKLLPIRPLYDRANPLPSCIMVLLECARDMRQTPHVRRLKPVLACTWCVTMSKCGGSAKQPSIYHTRPGFRWRG